MLLCLETLCYTSSMTLEIAGTSYLAANELLEELSISRQTLWRWRREGHIPQGHRFRDGKTVFTIAEADEVRRYANRIEPIDDAQRNQLGLF
jgi:predicted DNA-binding transcriptional regulator AlpA